MALIKRVIGRISQHMEDRGFLIANRCFYMVRNNMAFCVELESPGALLYASFYIIPLFIPCETRYHTYGNRIHSLPQANLSPLPKNADATEIDDWCIRLCGCLENIIFPFFEKVSTPQKLLDFVSERYNAPQRYIFCPDVQICRLQLFLYAYLGDNVGFVKTERTYRSLLHSCTYFTETVKSRFVQEIDGVELLMRKESQSIAEWFEQVESNTMKNCSLSEW